ncbi:sensor histidine kinase [Achromobacter pulmonis]|uniref:histidine kinase n=1 Tax=Achromobacter pulmonis TaxID=1389932 RepID=A0A2N8KNU1_9BURK|nr:ATP-binding protein [Achromobacter pulmonis]PND35121.1 sensor histidine kinase [Achromobacter pulmonis]
MKPLSRSGALLCWLVLFCLGAVWIGRQEYTDQHERFLQNTSVAQRMLSQKTVQHEAVLATLAALSHPPAPERLYPSLQPAMPQLLGLGHLHDGVWRGSMAAPDGLPEAIGRARQMRRPVTLPVDDARYWLAAPSGWSLLLDARQLVPAADFPPGLANLTLTVGAAPLRLLDKQPEGGAPGWRLALQKPLGAASQPFTMRSERRLTPDTWPWTAWLAWAVASALLVAGAVAWQRSRAEARRRQEQLRLGAMARLGALGEMAAGIAHELNQPLTAILAQTRAAERLLDDEEERPAVRRALLASAEQAKRAADIISRMRALVRPSSPGRREALDPDALVASLRFLREPELAGQGIRLTWRNASPGARPLGDRVALEQILHNLVQNAADALAGADGARHIALEGRADGASYLFSVSDTGPGIAADALPRLFAPFYTTRPQGMGLGLALCETLAGAMDGRIAARNLSPAGACFTLSLPLAGGAPAATGISHA